MPAVRIDPDTIRHSGTTPTITAGTPQTAGEDNVYKVRNNGQVRLLFENATNAAITVTFDVTRRLGGIADAVDPTADVPAASGGDDGRLWAGPFPRGVYNDGDGDLNFTVAGALAVTAVKG